MSTVQAQLTLLNLDIKNPRRFFLWTPGWTEWKCLHDFLATDQEYFVVAPAPTARAHVPPTTRHDPPIEPVTPEDISDKTVTLVFDGDTKPDGQTYTEIEEATNPSAKAEKQDHYGYFYDDFSAEKIDPDAKHSVQFNLPGRKKSDPADPRNRRTAERHHFKIEVILVNKHGRSFRTFSENISSGGTLLEDDLPKDFVNTRFDLILVNKFERDPSKGRIHFQGRIVGDYINPRRLMFLDLDEHTQKRLNSLLRSYAEHQRKLRGKKKSG